MLLHEYDPDLRVLSEEMLLGPQADILERIQAFNTRWLAQLPECKEIKCTKTFRWSPGMVDSVKTAAMQTLLQWHKKGNIKYVFSRRDDNQWQWNNMRDAIIGIDSSLASMRQQGIVFQDNSSIVQDKFVDWKAIVLNRLTEVNAFVNDQATFTVEITGDDDHFSMRKIVIHIKWHAPVIDVHHGDEHIGDVPFGPIELKLKMSLQRYINQLCIHDIDTLTTRNVIVGLCGRCSEDAGTNFNELTLAFPYISRRYSNYRSNDVIEWTNICLGDYRSQIESAVAKFDLMAIWTHLQGWKRYHYPHTNPLNNLRLAFYGMPGHQSQAFKRIVGQSENECATRLWRKITSGSLAYIDNNPNHYDESLRLRAAGTMEEMVGFCDEINCTLRNSCDRYILLSRSTGEPQTAEEQVEAISTSSSTLMEDIDAMNGPAQPATTTIEIPEEQPDVMTLEERGMEVLESLTHHEEERLNQMESDQDDVQTRMRQWANTWGNNNILTFDHQQQEGDNDVS
jgi:hypothetical protein